MIIWRKISPIKKKAVSENGKKNPGSDRVPDQTGKEER